MAHRFSFTKSVPSTLRGGGEKQQDGVFSSLALPLGDGGPGLRSRAAYVPGAGHYVGFVCSFVIESSLQSGPRDILGTRK